MESIRTGGGILRQFAKYVSFNMFSMLGLSAYFLADTFFIANGVGPQGLTALNLVLPVFSLFNGLGMMIGMGGATRFAVHNASHNPGAGNAAFVHAVYMALGLGCLFTLVGIFGTTPISRLLGADAQILPHAAGYLTTLLCFSLAFTVNHVMVCFVRNDGNPRLAMFAMLGSSFTNIVLDYLFVYPLDLGMFGAALATGLSPLVSLAVLLRHWRSANRSFRLVRTRPRAATALRGLTPGIPSFITELSSGVIMLAFNFTILGLAGNVGVAAYGVVANLALIAVAVYNGIAQGIQPLISSYQGEGDTRAIRQVFLLACALAAVLGVTFYLTGALFPQPIADAFNSENNAELTRIAVEGIRLYFLAFLLTGLNVVCAAFFAAVLQPMPSFLISFSRGIAAVLPLVLVLPALLGMTGVWLVTPLAELITLAVSGWFVAGYLRRTAEPSRRPVVEKI